MLPKYIMVTKVCGVSRGLLGRAAGFGLCQKDLRAGYDVGAGHHHTGRVSRDVCAALACLLHDDLFSVLCDGAT